MSEIKHLFFDLDNTILDFSYASHRAFSATMSHFSRPEEQHYQIYSEGNAKVWREFEMGLISAQKLRGKRFQVFLDRMGWEEDGYKWNEVYLHHVVNNNKFIDGAESLLNRLREKYHIHIVTNGLKEVQRPRLKKAGISSLLSSITVSDEIGYAKPNRGFFKIAMRNGQVSNPAEVLMIGDSYHSDIRGGASYGLTTCWYNPEKLKMDPKVHDFVIHDINSLEEVL
ncbi:YjjG family noncanonical pyrimidine nucleotidase [Portibacter marinus]|uniref:YjjG family noncanonical pyrimidine nucleotidase n=1 Tax=Portibacter marinus TaxID=2898660 RepID=UPI001F2D129F|nr:YjjG family noncanonical pyrimidine nucleotidase [Portibacter marinus]